MIKGLTKSGELIDANAPGAAHLVDTAEDGHEKFIESVRERHRLDSVREGGVAHVSIEGVAVPVSSDDTETPEEKLARLRAEGVVVEQGVVATTQGIKTPDEIAVAGVGVDPSKPAGNPDSPKEDYPPSDPPATSADELLLIEGLGKGVADKLIGANINSREALAAKTDAELDGIAGVGKTTIEEIRAFLERTAPTE